MGKHSKFSSSTEWRLGESAVLWPMEYLTLTVKCDIFITISHLFVCRPTLEFTKFEQQVCLTTQMHFHWEQTAAKKWNMTTLNSAHIKQKSSVILKVVSWNKSRVVYIASYESCEPKRLSRLCNKVERKYIQEQQRNQIYCYNQNMGFFNRIDQSLANYRIGIHMKKW